MWALTEFANIALFLNDSFCSHDCVFSPEIRSPYFFLQTDGLQLDILSWSISESQEGMAFPGLVASDGQLPMDLLKAAFADANGRISVVAKENIHLRVAVDSAK